MAARTVCSCSEKGPEETPVGVESSKLSACLRLQTTVSANCNHVKKGTLSLVSYLECRGYFGTGE